MTDKMKEFLVRIASGIVLAALVVGAALWSKWSWGVLLLAVVIGGTLEFYRLSRSCGASPLRFIGVVSSVAMYALGFTVFMQFDRISGPFDGAVVLTLLLYLLLIVPVAFVCELARRSRTPIADLSVTFFGVLYVALPVSLLLFIPLLLNNGVWQPWIMLSYILIIWVNDVFAYLVGVSIGRHKMSERISPKKSWEGFFGGVIAAIGAGLLCGWLLGGDIVVWGGLAAVVAVTGVAGDFAESMLKRSAGVKDSGRILPGHGGFLDRFDALILSAPFAFAYLILVGNL